MLKASKNGAVRRDALLRRVKAGRILAKCDGRYTDDYLFDASVDFGKSGWLKSRVKSWIVDRPATEDSPERGHYDFVEGQINFWEGSFKGKGGHAWIDHGQVVHLHVHSNLSYTLYVLEEGEDADEVLDRLQEEERKSYEDAKKIAADRKAAQESFDAEFASN